MNTRISNKRELIIDAAIQVFSQKGYHYTRMEDIAAQAGIGKGTIYEYFSSKLQLFQEMTEDSLQKYYESLTQEISDDLVFEERLRILMEGHFNFCQEHRSLARIVFWDTEIIDEELKDWTYKLRKEKETQMQEIIVEAIKKKEIRAIEPFLLSLIITGIFEAVWAPVIIENWEFDSKELADKVMDIIINGIGSTGTSECVKNHSK